ncbi:BPSL0761 family protein [Pseudomonas aeruginosa]
MAQQRQDRRGEVQAATASATGLACFIFRFLRRPLSRDTSLPERVRRDARFLLRHYPSRSDMLLAGRIEEHADTLPIGALGPVFSSTFTR